MPQTIQWIEDISFQTVSENCLWPIFVQDAENADYSLDIPSKGYILFTDTQMEEFEDTFIENIDILKRNSFWNPRSHFIVFACGKLEESPEEFADTVLTVLKQTNNIINAVLFMFTGDTSVYAYTLFPYLSGACNEDVTVLIGKWSVHDESEDCFNAIDFFPNKIPKRFTGCVLNIAGFGPEPYLIVENHKSEDGENKFVLGGVGLELINLFAREMNFTPNFVDAVTGFEPDDMIKLMATHSSGLIDIIAGSIPILDFIKPLADVSCPLFIDILKYVVPCPKPMKKTEKVIALFSLSTWAGMALVFMVVSVVFWTLSNYPTRRNDFTGFNLLAQSFSAAWAVLLGISVPQIPLSLGSRTLFIIYVWYCFAISTVFQGYFTTYLVEPGYEARLRTVDDVMRAELKLGFYRFMENFQVAIDLSDLEVFEEIIYVDMNECVNDVLFNGETFSLSLSYFPSFLASKAGVPDHSKVVCFLDNSITMIPMAVAVPVGHPLLDILNVHIRRCVEAGLLEGYWSKIKHDVNLKANKTDEDGEFVVFSLNHLSPVFMLLLFGYILSTILLVCELTASWISQISKIKSANN
ncbi:hypothetical protein L9F63_021272 [Diploptera punctata]|uniref:Uncharacterized protein n=1 Tax=Diploptera punctata TaxID=6984 RepID=A0AAD7ZR81_DIPPU|nr:hypothetical protein L9F63_021272 [Diploptera punctata]